MVAGLLQGLWNERPWGTVPFVKGMRTQLDAAGLNATRLVLWDGGVPGMDDPFWHGVADDSAFTSSFDAVREELSFLCCGLSYYYDYYD